MEAIILLKEALSPHLGWHGARLAFVATFLISLFRVRTVNLSELAVGFIGKATTESHYKRLQRFFREFEVDYSEIAKTVVRLMRLPEPWVLSCDRTEWQYGDTTFNILMLGVVHEGVVMPLVWTMLDKEGNSNTRERSELFNRFLVLFGDRKIDFLAADREFIGGNWFGYLLHQPHTPFRIRVKKNTLLNDGHRTLSADICFQDLQPEETKVLSKRRRIWGRWLYVTALRLEDGELLIVVTAHAPNSAIADYAKRWGIETLFGCFKTRGFCLESTHFNDPERLSKLIALLALALCWAMLAGIWQNIFHPIKIKKHGRPAKSLFRFGLDFLRRVFFDLNLNADNFSKALSFLSCT
jgi:Transposase DDE domain